MGCALEAGSWGHLSSQQAQESPLVIARGLIAGCLGNFGAHLEYSGVGGAAMNGSALWLQSERYHGEVLFDSGHQQISATKAILLVCVHPCPQQNLGNLEDSLTVISCDTEVKRSKARQAKSSMLTSAPRLLNFNTILRFLTGWSAASLRVVMQRAPPLAALPGVEKLPHLLLGLEVWAYWGHLSSQRATDLSIVKSYFLSNTH